MDFKPLVLSSFGEMSTNVKDYINLAVYYGAEHLGGTMLGCHYYGGGEDNSPAAIQESIYNRELERACQLSS
jgi:hypothetical protein